MSIKSLERYDKLVNVLDSIDSFTDTSIRIKIQNQTEDNEEIIKQFISEYLYSNHSKLIEAVKDLAIEEIKDLKIDAEATIIKMQARINSIDPEKLRETKPTKK